MTLLPRVSLAVFALLLVGAAPAAAESVKINVPAAPQPTYLYFEGNPDATGEFIVCVAGDAYGGIYEGRTDGDYYDGDPCPERTGDTELPPAGGGGGAPCGDMASCQALIEGIIGDGGDPPFPCGDMATCQAFFESLIPEGGGGPPTPCSDMDSCQTFFEGIVGGLGGGGGGGAPGAPGPRDCTGAEGGEATCVDLGPGNFLLGDPPDDGAGELGVCIQGKYFYVAGPGDPTGGADKPCPAAAPAPAPTTPPSSGGGDGGGGSTTPPPSSGGDSGGTSGGTTDGGSTSQPPAESQPQQSRPADPPETVRVDVARNRLRVTRTGRLGVPLTCKTERTACRGVLRLTATRRTSSGRRVRVLLARAEFLVQPGKTSVRKMRLTRAGRKLVAARKRTRARATTSVASSSGRVERGERVVLRRR